MQAPGSASPTRPGSIVLVVGTIVLTLGLVLNPAFVLAGGDEAFPTPEEPEPTAKRVASNLGLERPGPTNAKADAGSTSTKLVIDPDELTLTVGASAVLRAWVCDTKHGKANVGSDKEPGTKDDSCLAAKKAEWSVAGQGSVDASKVEGPSIKVEGASSGDVKVSAELRAMKAAMTVKVKPEPKAEKKAEEKKVKEPKPETKPEKKVEEPKAEPEPKPKKKADEKKVKVPKAEKRAGERKVEEPKAEQPKAEKKKAEQPKAEPEPEPKKKAEQPKAEKKKVEDPKTEKRPEAEKKPEEKKVEEPEFESRPELEPTVPDGEPLVEPVPPVDPAVEPLAGTALEPEPVTEPPADPRPASEPLSEPIASAAIDSVRFRVSAFQGQRSTGKQAFVLPFVDVSAYAEGDTVNFRLRLASNDATLGAFRVDTTEAGGCTVFDDVLELGTDGVLSTGPMLAPIDGALPTVSNAGRIVSVDFGGKAGKAWLYFHLRLAEDAADCSGIATVDTSAVENARVLTVPLFIAADPLLDGEREQLSVHISVGALDYGVVTAGSAGETSFSWSIVSNRPVAVDFAGSEFDRVGGAAALAEDTRSVRIWDDTQSPGTKMVKHPDIDGDAYYPTSAVEAVSPMLHSSVDRCTEEPSNWCPGGLSLKVRPPASTPAGDYEGSIELTFYTLPPG